MYKVSMFPSDELLIKDDIIRFIGNKKLDIAWFLPPEPKNYQVQHIYFAIKSELSVGDWCSFYGNPSEILEINGTSAKIRTMTELSEDDAEMVNNIKKEKVVNAGDISSFTHSFSVSQMDKIVISSDKRVTPNKLLPESVKVLFVKNYNDGRPMCTLNLGNPLLYGMDIQNIKRNISNKLRNKNV